MADICSRIRVMPSALSSVLVFPACEMATVFWALSETYRAFSVATWAVCRTSSTVAVVSATAVAVNLAVFLPTDGGDLRLYPAGGAAPLASAINFRPGIIRANNAIIPLGAGGQISVQCDMPSGSTRFFLDVYGYFQ